MKSAFLPFFIVGPSPSTSTHAKVKRHPPLVIPTVAERRDLRFHSTSNKCSRGGLPASLMLRIEGSASRKLFLRSANLFRVDVF
jgi:hypothetical protein